MSDGSDPARRAAARDQLERLADHPAIDRRHQVVALGGGNERHRRDHLIVRVDHAEQQLEVALGRIHRPDSDDRLREQAEAIGLQRALQPRHPLHFAVPDRELGILRVVDMDAIAALFLGHVARGVAGAHHARRA